MYLLCQKYIAEMLLCSDKRILGYKLSALILTWQFWMSASWEMQQKAPTQMHFIITIITDNPLRDVGFFFCWGWGVLASFPLSTFHLHYFCNAWHSIWKKLCEQIHCLHGSLYHDEFNDSRNQVCMSIRLPGAAKETNPYPTPLEAD